MSKSVEWPKCWTCDLTRPIKGNKDSKWCHGAPLSAFPELKVEIVQGQPQQMKTISSAYPPIGRQTEGCALHPMMRARLKAGGRV